MRVSNDIGVLSSFTDAARLQQLRSAGGGARCALFTATLCLAWASTASAYIGDGIDDEKSDPSVEVAFIFGFQAPGLFYALKRNADGLKDPVTGECNGISMVYEIDGIQSFIAPASSGAKKSRT